MITVGYIRVACPMCGAVGGRRGEGPRQYGRLEAGGRRYYRCESCECRFAALPVPQPVLACPGTLRGKLQG